MIRTQSTRVKPTELLDFVRELKLDGDQRAAFLCIHLHRTDRVSALAGSSEATETLRQAVQRITQHLHQEDKFALVSNEAIWFLLPNIDSESFALLTAQAIRDSLSEPFVRALADGKRHTAQMRPSIGMAYLTQSGLAPEIIARVADDAAESAAVMGDRLKSISLKPDALPTAFADIEAEVRKALFENELEVYLQPQVDLTTQRCESAEALVRLIRPDGSSIRADIVAKVCLEGGMMDTLTRYIINNVLRSQMNMASLGIDIPIAVNLSASTMSDPTFPDMIAQAAGTWGASPSKLTIELTESSIVENEYTAIKFMKHLRALGCALALDDFGTGYSSFSYLREFPISELKIDRIFITHLVERDKDRRIVQALLELCRAFELTSVCEGIENQQTQQLLRQMGCDRGQGYWFGKAMNVDNFCTWHREFTNKAKPVARGASRPIIA